MRDPLHPPPQPPAPPPRLGPRPLGLHLTTAVMTWLSSRTALPLLMSGSLPLKAALAPAAAELRSSLDGVAPELLAAALERQVRRRLERYLSGLERYRHHPYRRALVDPPAIWSEGTTLLRDYGSTAALPAGAPVVLFVPSLVNRGYILDLAEGSSFLRWLARAGFRALLVDWGRPGPAERSFDLSDYVAGRLERMLDQAVELARGPVGLVGYCMGGNLALALAARRGKDVKALALLATPWDFHAERPELARAIAASAGPLLAAAARVGELSTDVLQALFFLLDPYLAPRKFVRFADFEPGSRRELAFVALEDWLNDGVPLAAKVARECLVGWYGENRPAEGEWRIAGEPVEPRKLKLPTLVVVPARDRIVPPPSAEALVGLIPGAARLQPSLGHIGMMASAAAEGAAWRPLAAWLAGQPWARPRRKAGGSHAPAALPSQVQQTYNPPSRSARARTVPRRIPR
ncbi:MAG TPA: alpha/beta fold hydrolase [Alphaproteobacteria bacterium]|nr:alpha/beta fold hydrolase [Alphaproteobacteria bacterium]